MIKRNTILNIILFIILSLSMGCSSSSVQTTANDATAIQADNILDHIKYLASDELKGRFPATPEDKLVEKYYVEHWKEYGLLPGGENGTYTQKFDVMTGVELGPDNYLKINGNDVELNVDYAPYGFGGSDEFQSEVVFVGFGLSLNKKVQWDDYAGMDVKDKWVLFFTSAPDLGKEARGFVIQDLQRKVLTAKDKGVKGVLVVSPGIPTKIPTLAYNQRLGESTIPVLYLSPKTANEIVKGMNVTVESVEKELKDTKKPHSFVVENTVVSANVNINKIMGTTANLMAVLPGTDPKYKDEYIIIGAHKDHLGLGGPGTASTVPEILGQVHNGADDNASGDAGVLELSRKLALNRDKLKRPILFMGFGAEEMGVLGSSYFTEHPTLDLAKVPVMVNMDMIGRPEGDRLIIFGTQSSPNFKKSLEKINKNFNFSFSYNDQGIGSSDNFPFYNKDIPALFFFAGANEDYHKPSDDWEKINIENEAKILEYVYATVMYYDNLDERPVFSKMKETGPKQSRTGLTVSMGITPGFGSLAKGLKVKGTTPGKPAEKGGIIKEDIIIEIGGKSVTGIRDYMYRLQDLNPGDTVKVKVKRDDKIVELDITL